MLITAVFSRSVQLNSPFIVGLNNSDIVANAEQGDGGNIDANDQHANSGSQESQYL